MEGACRTCVHIIYISVEKLPLLQNSITSLKLCENSVLFGFLFSPEVQFWAVHLIISMVNQSLGVEEDMSIIYNKRTFWFSLWLSKFSYVEWQPFWITFLIKRVYKIFFGYVLLYQNDVNTAKKERNLRIAIYTLYFPRSWPDEHHTALDYTKIGHMVHLPHE